MGPPRGGERRPSRPPPRPRVLRKRRKPIPAPRRRCRPRFPNWSGNWACRTPRTMDAASPARRAASGGARLRRHREALEEHDPDGPPGVSRRRRRHPVWTPHVRRAPRNPKEGVRSRSNRRSAQGGQPTEIAELVEGIGRTRPHAGAVSVTGLRQELHHGQGDGRRSALALILHRTSARRELYFFWRASSRLLPRQTRSSIRLVLRVYQPEGLSPSPRHHIERNPRSTSRSTACDIRRPRAARRDDVIIVASCPASRYRLGRDL